MRGQHCDQPIRAHLELARLLSSVTLLSAASRQRPRMPAQFCASGLRMMVLLRLGTNQR